MDIRLGDGSITQKKSNKSKILLLGLSALVGVIYLVAYSVSTITEKEIATYISNKYNVQAEITAYDKVEGKRLAKGVANGQDFEVVVDGKFLQTITSETYSTFHRLTVAEEKLNKEAQLIEAIGFKAYEDKPDYVKYNEDGKLTVELRYKNDLVITHLEEVDYENIYSLVTVIKSSTIDVDEVVLYGDVEGSLTLHHPMYMGSYEDFKTAVEGTNNSIPAPKTDIEISEEKALEEKEALEGVDETEPTVTGEDKE